MTANLRQSTQFRQAEIIAAMLALAAERNPSEITTTDIAKAMNVTQGAVFRHFPTKEAIRLAVVEWIEMSLLEALHGARQNSLDALAALEAMFMAHVEFTLKFPGAPRLIFAELQPPDASPVRQRVKKIMQGYRHMLAGVLAEASESGQVRDDLDCPAAASLFLGAVQGMVIQSLLGSSPDEARALARSVVRIYLASLKEKP